MSSKFKYAVYAQMKDEDNIIEQWIDHYNSLGFEHIYIMNDQSAESFNEKIKNHKLYDKITIINVDFTTEQFINGNFEHSSLYNKNIVEIFKKQKQSYLLNIFRKLYMSEIEWLLICDADEFLYLRDCQTILEYIEKKLEKYPDVGQICFNWVNYGTSYHSYFPKGNLFENFILSQNTIDPETKSMIKIKDSYSLDIHRSGLCALKKTYCISPDGFLEFSMFEKIYGKLNYGYPKDIHYGKVDAFMAHYIYMDYYTFITRKLKRMRASSCIIPRKEFLFCRKEFNDTENYSMLKYSTNIHVKKIVPNKKIDISKYNQINGTAFINLIDVILHFYDNKTELYYSVDNENK